MLNNFFIGRVADPDPQGVGSGVGFQNMVGSKSGSQNIVGSGSGLNIKSFVIHLKFTLNPDPQLFFSVW